LYCPKCGKMLAESYSFCTACGTQVVALPPPERPPRSGRVYAWLGGIFGVFGVHDFYAGYPGRGLIKLSVFALSLGKLSGVNLVWTAVQLFTVRQDAKRRAFLPTEPTLRRIFGVLLLMIAIGLSGFILKDAIVDRLRTRDQAGCFERLRQADAAFRQYAETHDGRLPDGEWMEQIGLPELFCPLGERQPYAFIAAGLKLDELPPKTPILLENRAIHHHDSANVLFADGTERCVRGNFANYEELARQASQGAAPEAVLEQARALDRLNW